MGNEGSRASSLRRNLSRRASKNQSSGHQYIAEDEVDAAGRTTTTTTTTNNGEMTLQTPKPNKRMDKIRRSLSFRKKKKHSDEGRSKLQSQTSSDLHGSAQQATPGAMSASASVPTSIAGLRPKEASASGEKAASVKPATWVEDEKRVRAGNCSFQVKYLGSLEVSDSRGMHLCESAIERLLAVSIQRQKTFKSHRTVAKIRRIFDFKSPQNCLKVGEMFWFSTPF
jgi:hypothetical protein